MNDYFLIAAGIGGMFIAIVHGILGHKRVLTRVEGLPSSLSRVNYAVFQMSTIYWFVGGMGLMLSPWVFSNERHGIIVAVVAVLYSVGAIGNFWATNGRHYGWILLLVVTILAVLGLRSS